MTHFAIMCPEVPGHANSMNAVASELQRRGHKISWIGALDAEEEVKRRGFDSLIAGVSESPLGTRKKFMDQLGEMTGVAALAFTLEHYRKAMEVVLREVPGMLRDCRADAIIADETVFTTRTVAEHCDLPWVSICSAMPLHPDPELPPNGMPFSYGTTLYHQLRNRLGYAFARWMTRRIERMVKEARVELGLPDYNFQTENTSRLATIAQMTREFDFPRRRVPPWFHYVGSLQHAGARDPVAFPFDQLDPQRPLIYASMGTLQNRLLPLFHRMAEACASTSMQLVISLGGGGKPEDLGALPGDPIVVEYAPQLELLKRASMVITHGGMNTVSESISAGVPMLAIPVTNDQPSVAARLAWSGCGEKLSIRQASADRINAAIQRMVSNPQYAAKAKALAECNHRAGGVVRAADIIETSIGER